MPSFVYDLWKKALWPWLDSVWACATFWRTSTLVLVTVMLIIWLLRRKLAAWLAGGKRADHDVAIYETSDKHMSEANFRLLVRTVGNTHAYTSGLAAPVDRFLRFFELTGNQFIDRRIRKACVRLVKSLRRLMGFLALNFFVYPPKQTSKDSRYCMHPRLNADREGSGTLEEMAEYRHHERELHALLDRAEASYAHYRSLVKSRLKL